jgi:rhodanese-related sulfurtransferase
MKFLVILFAFFTTSHCFSQNTIQEALEKLNKQTVPYITVEALHASAEIILLDSREVKEFKVSHIKNAVNVGFDKFNSALIATKFKDKNVPIVVYCSIGVRSEKIGEKLLKMGFKNVSNLYGGIFEWKNKGGKVVAGKDVETDRVHTFNKEWSQYLKKGIKIYEN